MNRALTLLVAALATACSSVDPLTQIPADAGIPGSRDAQPAHDAASLVDASAPTDAASSVDATAPADATAADAAAPADATTAADAAPPADDAGAADASSCPQGAVDREVVADLDLRDLGVIWDGVRFVAVWASSPVTGTPDLVSSFIGILDPSGAIALDGRTEVAAARDSIAKLTPRIAANGTGYGVIFSDEAFLPNAPSPQLYFVALDAAGQVVGSPIPISTSVDAQYAGSIAWNPLRSEWGVMWADATPSSLSVTIRFERISAAGAIIANSQVILANATFSALDASGGNGALIWAGTRWAAGWADVGAVYLEEVSSDGVPALASRTVFNSGGSVVPINGHSGEGPSLTWSGTEYGVAWSEHSGMNLFPIFFGRAYSGGGVVPGSTGRVNPLDGYYSAAPALTWDGSGYVVAWGRGDRAGSVITLWMARLDASGRALTVGPVDCGSGAATTGGASIAWSGSLHALTYSATSSTNQVTGRLLLFP